MFRYYLVSQHLFLLSLSLCIISVKILDFQFRKLPLVPCTTECNWICHVTTDPVPTPRINANKYRPHPPKAMNYKKFNFQKA